MMKERPEDLGEIKEITLIGEGGEAEVFDHVLTFMYESERYMALIPSEQADEEEPELVFMHVEPDKAKGDKYSVVDNEVLCEELFEVFCELMDELDDDEDEEEEQ